MFFSVDAHAIGCRLTGNETYVRNLLHGLARLDQHADFLAFVSVEGAENQVPARFSTCRVSRNPFLRLGRDLTRQLRRHKPDLLHVQYTAPLLCPVPVVVSVHDVSFLEHPGFFPQARALQLRTTVARTVRRAARILTPSEFSRIAISRAYHIDPEQITVVPNAADTKFRPISRSLAAARVYERLGIRTPFILTVGDLQPRKNQTGLVEAFGSLIRSHPGLRHSLVLAGKQNWKGSRVAETVRRAGIADRVHLTGFVNDEDLVYLYNACEVFVFPSLYEGFGLPVLEAMACGRAVACSHTSSLPEVADGAGIFFDPQSKESIARALRDLLIDPELRGRMERLGLQRSSDFSWESAARRTLEVYYQVAAGQRRAERARVAVPGR